MLAEAMLPLMFATHIITPCYLLHAAVTLAAYAMMPLRLIRH